jgi:hypothetical protein
MVVRSAVYAGELCVRPELRKPDWANSASDVAATRPASLLDVLSQRNAQRLLQLESATLDAADAVKHAVQYLAPATVELTVRFRPQTHTRVSERKTLGASAARLALLPVKLSQHNQQRLLQRWRAALNVSDAVKHAMQYLAACCALPGTRHGRANSACRTRQA